MKSYRYVDGIFEELLEVKHSKFIATVCGELDADGAEAFVKSVKKKYPDATHNCYAYVSDVNGQATRFSDDGEPGGTAGQPILEVIRKKGLVKTAIVVTRYFGGIKLGAGGLVSAYTEAAVNAIESAVVSEKTECASITVKADYNVYATVDSYLKRNGLLAEDVKYLEDVEGKIWTATDNLDTLASALSELTAGKAQITTDKTNFEYRKSV